MDSLRWKKFTRRSHMHSHLCRTDTFSIIEPKPAQQKLSLQKKSLPPLDHDCRILPCPERSHYTHLWVTLQESSCLLKVLEFEFFHDLRQIFKVKIGQRKSSKTMGSQETGSKFNQTSLITVHVNHSWKGAIPCIKKKGYRGQVIKQGTKNYWVKSEQQNIEGLRHFLLILITFPFAQQRLREPVL